MCVFGLCLEFLMVVRFMLIDVFVHCTFSLYIVVVMFEFTCSALYGDTLRIMPGGFFKNQVATHPQF